MRKLFLLFFCSICMSYTPQAKTQLDSLRHILDTTQNTEVLLDAYYDLALLYENVDNDSALYYLKKGFTIADKEGFNRMQGLFRDRHGIVISYSGNYRSAIDKSRSALAYLEDEFDNIRGNIFNSIAISYYRLSEYDSARFYWSKAMHVYEHNNDSARMGTVYGNLGAVDYVQSKYEDALQNFIASLELKEKFGSKQALASVYMKLALIYNELGNYRKEYAYFKDALEIYRSSGEELSMAQAMVNLSNTYFLLDSLNEARTMLIDAQKIAEDIGNLQFLAAIYSNLSSLYYEDKMHDSVLKYCYKARDLYEELGHKRELTVVYKDIGKAFFDMADYDAAIAYFKSAWELMVEIDIYELRAEVLDLLAQSYGNKNNFKEAYFYQRKYSEVIDTLAFRESREKLRLLEGQFHEKQQEQRIEILEKQKQLDAVKLQKSISTRNLLFLIIALVILTVLLVYLKYRQKSYLNKALREQNEEVNKKNEEISLQSKRLKEFNYELVKKNKLIESQKKDLEAHNRTKDRFFSIIGHDLRSPIASMYNTVVLLKIKQLSQNRQQELLTFVQNSLKATLELLENLMLWAKSQDQGIETKKVEASINSIIKNTIEAVQGVAKTKDVNISFAVEKEYTAVVDANMIGTVLRNLLTNAIKFSNEGGNVEVFVKPQEDRLRISVSDQGVGMAQETLEQVLSGKGNYSTRGTRQERGAGLGLVLVRNFIEKHGGRLEIKSEPGKGSIFSFSIPVN